MNIKKQYLEKIDDLILLAIQEDIGIGDITTNYIVSSSTKAKAFLKSKDDGIICGLDVVKKVFRKFDPNIKIKKLVNDGDLVKPGDILAYIEGNYNALLSGERIALNFLQRMSGVATKTNLFVTKVKDYSTKILDTRKTIPGYRLIDKYSVLTGGGTNHRIGLYDLVMIKDNHIEIAGGITNAVNYVRKNLSDKKIKIEVETKSIKEVKEALDLKVDIIMLDNMSTSLMKKCVDIIGGKAKTEASGNVTLKRVEAIAKTGVDFISIGELTHSVKALDIGMYIEVK